MSQNLLNPKKSYFIKYKNPSYHPPTLNWVSKIIFYILLLAHKYTYKCVEVYLAMRHGHIEV